MKFIKGTEEVGNTASKAIKFSHQHTVKLMAACGPHQRLELRPAFLSTRDGDIHVLRNHFQPGTCSVVAETVGLEIKLLSNY